MAGIRLFQFGAETPRLAPHLLPANGAQTAKNTNLLRGSIAPWRDALSSGYDLGSSVKTLHRTNAGKFIGWNLDVNIARSTNPGDVLERIYWSGDSYPRMMAIASIAGLPNATLISGISSSYIFKLGIPAATSAPTVSLGGGTGTDQRYRSYCYTFVSVYGEESAPSPASAQALVYQGQSVSVGTLAPAGAPPNIVGKRIYRTDSGGTYRLVNTSGDLVASSLTYIDNAPDTALGEAIATSGWLPPPSSLQGLKAGPNGVLAGFFGNTLAFSEPFAPYAWPVAYQLTTDYNIVAICATSGGWIVATEGTPYFAMGSYPSSISLARIDQVQACVSATSMVDMGDYAIYASPDGLVGAQGGDVQLISKEAITRDQWQAIKPESIRAYLYQGQYFGFYDTGTVQGGFLFDPVRKDFVWFDLYAKAGVIDLLKDNLWLYVGSLIKQWDAGSALTYTWKSKRYTFAKTTNVGAGWVDASSYPVTFKVYADGVLVATVTVADKRPFKLPGGYAANSFEVELSGTAEISNIAIGTDVAGVLAA